MLCIHDDRIASNAPCTADSFVSSGTDSEGPDRPAIGFNMLCEFKSRNRKTTKKQKNDKVEPFLAKCSMTCTLQGINIGMEVSDNKGAFGKQDI